MQVSLQLPTQRHSRRTDPVTAATVGPLVGPSPPTLAVSLNITTQHHRRPVPTRDALMPPLAVSMALEHESDYLLYVEVHGEVEDDSVPVFRRS
jgi:hypothetical protein